MKVKLLKGYPIQSYNHSFRNLIQRSLTICMLHSFLYPSLGICMGPSSGWVLILWSTALSTLLFSYVV